MVELMAWCHYKNMFCVLKGFKCWLDLDQMELIKATILNQHMFTSLMYIMHL